MTAYNPPSTRGWVLRGVEGAFMLSGRTSGYDCQLGPRLERGGRRTTASHQSGPRTLAPSADGSGQNPSRNGDPWAVRLDSGADAEAGRSSWDYVTASPVRQGRTLSKALEERQPSGARNGFGSGYPSHGVKRPRTPR